jgi:triosephosphate isomerase
MNKTTTEARAYFEALLPLVEGRDARQVFVLPPFTAIWVAREMLAGTPIAWGGQDVSPDPPGAHTGDISAEMLADLGCQFAEVGHSERRRDHAESDERIAAKVGRALAAGLTPILCVGERRPLASPRARSVVVRQLAGSLAGIASADLGRVAVAYEPVWAIGAGAVAASVEHVAFIHHAIGSWMRERGVASPRVIYGGSVDPGNAASLLAINGVDGLFVGRAALDPVAFASIAKLPFQGTEEVG